MSNVEIDAVATAHELLKTRACVVELEKLRKCDQEIIQALSKRIENDEIERKRLRDALATQSYETEQILGKALDFPWYKDDQRNFPGTTEQDGVCVGDHVPATLAALAARKLDATRTEGNEGQQVFQAVKNMMHEPGILVNGGKPRMEEGSMTWQNIYSRVAEMMEEAKGEQR